ncbi:IS256 family transposase, partial [Streptomyces sp. NPDC056534]
VFKLVGSARTRWRAVTAPHLVALVRAGARFETVTSSNETRPSRHEPPQPIHNS